MVDVAQEDGQNTYGSGSGLDPDSIRSVDSDPGQWIRIQEGENDT